MTLELIIRPEAEADAREAFHWYDERLPGLGQAFLSELDREFRSILESPESRARIHRDLRRALLHRFPYGVFYVVESTRIVVVAILHTARNPRTWRRRGIARTPEE